MKKNKKLLKINNIILFIQIHESEIDGSGQHDPYLLGGSEMLLGLVAILIPSRRVPGSYFQFLLRLIFPIKFLNHSLSLYIMLSYTQLLEGNHR